LTRKGSFVPEVLLIDDNLAQLRIREAVLRAAGISVACASTAVEAFAFLRPRTDVDVIVTDHVMPGVSGSVFVRQLHDLRPQVPVIVISGLAEAEEEYAGLGVTFLRKPCPPESLIRAVNICRQDRS
jgi:CheY-like chemotaxis protein